ncbi:hypothetical protein PRIPAC_96110 [Pristionchus pacificus]|uniref:G protein-coupled receptor n=1 Tax=Pristionchus pacificus TaxID=54126 RepID=A0A2A6B318_PRIPA|nr:hypothetical protein PRIPAC_96110 [Pristionchus pacificus]|eukprot:PDM60277.1 G protein-coupled receptor [Pristionchus pacificus]
MRIYRWFLMQLVVLSALQDFILHKESTAFWHIGACLIILVPWPMLDISRDKMRAELERTYPNVIHVMETQRTFLMYTFDKDSIWFYSLYSVHLEALFPMMFRLIPDISMIVSAFCLRDLNSSIFGRIAVSVSSVHSIINSLLVIFLHKPFRDRMFEWLNPIYVCRKAATIKTIERRQSSHREFLLSSFFSLRHSYSALNWHD